MHTMGISQSRVLHCNDTAIKPLGNVGKLSGEKEWGGGKGEWRQGQSKMGNGRVDQVSRGGRIGSANTADVLAPPQA